MNYIQPLLRFLYLISFSSCVLFFQGHAQCGSGETLVYQESFEDESNQALSGSSDEGNNYTWSATEDQNPINTAEFSFFGVDGGFGNFESTNAEGTWETQGIPIDCYLSVSFEVLVRKFGSDDLDSDDFVQIEYSTNNGGSWTEAFMGSEGFSGGTTVTVTDLTGDFLVIRANFRSDDGSELLTIDDIIVCGERSTPSFDPIGPFCEGESAPPLPGQSDDMPPIPGSWTPPSINTSVVGISTYTFTPDDTDCYNSVDIDIEIQGSVEANPAGPLRTCPNPDGNHVFDLTSLDDQIGDGRSVVWHEDLPISSSNSISDPANYITTPPDEVYAVVMGGPGECNSAPEGVQLLGPSDPVDICDPGELTACLRIDGTAEFNLSEVDNQVNCGNGFTVNWYEDAAGTVPVADPSAFVFNFGTPPGFPIVPPTLDGQVFAQVEDNDGCTSEIIAVDLRATIGPSTTLSPDPIQICLDPETRDGEVDLDPYNSQINTMGGEVQWWGWEGLPNLPFLIGTGGTVTVEPPATLFGIYIDGNDCIYAPSTLDVEAHPIPDIEEPMDLRVCANENDEAVIDLTTLEADIGNGDIEWYEDEDLNIQITDPENFVVPEGTQTIYVINVDPSTGCPSATEEMQITVDPFPVGNPVGPFFLCSDPGTNTTTVDLTENNQDIVGATVNSVQWYSDPDATMDIVDPMAHLVEAPQTTVYAQVIGQAPLNCPGEIIEVIYEVNVSPQLFPPDPIDICVPADENMMTIDLTTYNDQIYTGGGMLEWYTDAAASFQILDPENYQAAIPLQDVYARAVENGCPSNIVALSFNQLPAPMANPADIQSCDDGSGLGLYDLTTIIDQINGGSGDQVRFFEDYDGEELSGEIGDLQAYETDKSIIYAIVDNGQCQSAVVEVNLELTGQAFLNDIGPFTTCPDANGNATIDLTAYDDDLLGNQNGVITWYEDDQLTEINDPENFVINGPVTVSARAGANSDCPSDFVDITFSLGSGVSYETPNNPYLVCVDPASGQAIIDLRSYLDSIYNGNGMASWETTDGTAISNDSMHIVTPLDSVFLSINEGTCATDTLILFTFAERPPINADPAALSACDNGNGTANFDLTSLVATINLGTGLNVEFFEDQALTNPIPSPENYNSGDDIIYAIVRDGNCSSNVVQVTLTVQQSAAVCADDFSFCSTTGSLIVDLTNLNDSVNCGDGSVVSWYSDRMAGSDDLISTPINITMTTDVYVVVGSGTCATSPTAITLNLLQAPQITTDTLRECADPTPIDFDLTAIENSINMGSGLPVFWFEDASTTTPITDPTTYIANDTTQVFAFVSDGICSSDTVAVVLEVIDIPDFNVPEIDECGDANGNLTLDLTRYNDIINSNASIEWFEDRAGASPISNASAYNTSTGSIFARVTVAGCSSDIFKIPITIRICNCTTRAPELSPAEIELCLPGRTTIDTIAQTMILEGGDDFQFIIHDGDASTIGTIIDRNQTGLFLFSPAQYTSGQTYYIHAVAGPVDQTTGAIDFDDDCFDISDQGVPITFFSPPSLVDEDTESLLACSGDSISVLLEFELPNQNYSFTFLNAQTGDIDSIVTGVLNGSVYEWILTPQTSTEYIILDISYADGPSCNSSSTKVISIDIVDELIAVQQDVQCTSDSTYVVEILVTGGGGQGNVVYSPSSTHGGVFVTDRLFVSDPVPSEEASVFVFNGACMTNANVQVPAQDCSNPCITNAGQISVDTSQACQNEFINVLASGNQLDNDDLVFFVVHEQPDLLSSNFRVVQTNRQIEFDPAMTVGQDYYVTMVVGNGMENGGFDEDDPCLDFSNTVVIRFLPIVQVSLIPENDAVCLGDSLSVQLELGGFNSVDITINYPDGIVEFSNVSDGQELRLYTESTGNWGISEISGAEGCFVLGSPVLVNISNLSVDIMGTSNYNGFEVSCEGLNDGSAIVQTFNGVQPFTFLWSDGVTGIERDRLRAERYDVTVTDNAGCIDSANIELSQPPAIDISGIAEDPGCFGGANGLIMVNSVSGGTGSDYNLFLNGFEIEPIDATQLPYTIPDVSAGMYEVGVLDGNNCYGAFDVTLTNPSERPININRSSVPGDSIVRLGQSLQLEVQGAFTYDTVEWTTDYNYECLNPPLCDIISITPMQTGEVSVRVEDEGGCTSSTSKIIRVSTELSVFTPSAFSPNGDGFNDYFTIYSDQIERIERMQVFDRWGNLLFVQEDFLPGVENLGWDGTTNNEPLNPGVYVFSAEVVYVNGEQRLISGDITLVK